MRRRYSTRAGVLPASADESSCLRPCDQTILVQVINPGLKRELKSAADLDAVLSKLSTGDVVTFLVYDLGQTDGSSALRSVTLQVGS
jgi:hypothetical protein